MYGKVFRQLGKKSAMCLLPQKAPFSLCECQLLMGVGEFWQPETSTYLLCPVWMRKYNNIWDLNEETFSFCIGSWIFKMNQIPSSEKHLTLRYLLTGRLRSEIYSLNFLFCDTCVSSLCITMQQLGKKVCLIIRAEDRAWRERIFTQLETLFSRLSTATEERELYEATYGP